jgi:hypothetical protein
MDAEILKYVFTQSVFGGLFIWLLIDTQKKNQKREERGETRESAYQSLIKELTSKFEMINTVSCKLDKVEDKIEEILRK